MPIHQQRAQKHFIAKNVYEILQYTLKNPSFPECIYVYFLWLVEWLKAILKIKKSPGNSFYYVYNFGLQASFRIAKSILQICQVGIFQFQNISVREKHYINPRYFKCYV